MCPVGRGTGWESNCTLVNAVLAFSVSVTITLLKDYDLFSYECSKGAPVSQYITYMYIKYTQRSPYSGNQDTDGIGLKNPTGRRWEDKTDNTANL